MRITFSSPQAEFECIQAAWLQRVEETARRGVFVGGTEVAQFEEAFANYAHVPHAIGVGNGTDALYLALKSLGIGPGDEVITAANTFIATVEAIHHTGAKPVLVDCDPATYLLQLEQVRASCTQATKAIIPVHLYGQMVEMDKLNALAAERGIAVIEDSAQAAGARYQGKPAGSWGELGCFSFYPDKNLGALGDGGAVVTVSDERAASLRKLRNHGGTTRYEHDLPGFNSRLDTIQAMALALKLDYLDEWSRHRRQAAKWYSEYLRDAASLQLPAQRDEESHVYHLYVVRTEAAQRDKLKKHLQKRGILTAIQYPTPVHLTPAFAHLGYGPGDFPEAERAAGEILSLPMHIGMGEEQAAYVAEAVKEIAGRVLA